ncbi:MAG: GerW family sporulation protein [Lachnospiraceae bacterium]|nr:GerW family sporulation protein [Lachnospiraceae bacterium]
MANNSFSNNAEALFKGMEGFFTSKTVVGEPVKYGDTVIIPLMEISFGMGAGSMDGNKSSGGGGVGAKMTPCAVLVLQNGTSKLISVRDQSGVAKVLDLVPDFVNKFMDKGSTTEAEENLDEIFEDGKEEPTDAV